MCVYQTVTKSTTKTGERRNGFGFTGYMKTFFWLGEHLTFGEFVYFDDHVDVFGAIPGNDILASLSKIIIRSCDNSLDHAYWESLKQKIKITYFFEYIFNVKKT